MSRVKMVLDIDFDELQKTKQEILNLALGTEEHKSKVLSSIVFLIEKIQDQILDNPQNSYTQKQVFGV